MRCGWCITGDHISCVVVIEMGVTTDQGQARAAKRRAPYFWVCGCESPKRHPKDRCVDCSRTGVPMVDHRCRDTSACRAGKKAKRKVRQIMVGVGDG